MSDELNLPGSSAAEKGEQKHTLISAARARQLFELTLDLQNGSQGNVEWQSGREAVLAAVIADLRSGDALLTESSLRIGETVRLPVAARWPGGTKMADLLVESLAAATADRLRKNGRVTVVFLPPANGDSLPAEARTVAAAAKLPVLFVEDARDRALTNRNIDPNAMPSIPVDADDGIALYRVAHESIARARHGGGPTQITCVRWSHRSGNQGDAIQRLEQWLNARGLPAQAWREEIAARQQSARRSAPRPKTKPTRTEAAAHRADAQLFAPPDIQTNGMANSGRTAPATESRDRIEESWQPK